VCVLDLDIQLGSAALYLDLPSKSSVIDLHGAIARVDGSMLRTAMAHHRCGVDVLAAPAHVQPLEELTPEGIMRLLLIARREYREIMIDLPPVWTRWTRALIRGSDALVLILQPSVPAVRQAKRQLDTLLEEGLEDVPVTLIMNRVEQQSLFRRPMNEVTLNDAATALGRKIAYTVPNDYASMIQAINQGLPLFEVNGAQAIAKRVAENIDSILAQVSAHQAHPILAQQ
jgi:pilus assembly protein CpaE